MREIKFEKRVVKGREVLYAHLGKFEWVERMSAQQVRRVAGAARAAT
jgi:hypothetical protein